MYYILYCKALALAETCPLGVVPQLQALCNTQCIFTCTCIVDVPVYMGCY